MAAGLSRFADAFVMAECWRMRLSLAETLEENERLQHELVLAQHRVEAAEQQADLYLKSQATNLKLLDHIVLTHGINSGRNSQSDGDGGRTRGGGRT